MILRKAEMEATKVFDQLLLFYLALIIGLHNVSFCLVFVC